MKVKVYVWRDTPPKEFGVKCGVTRIQLPPTPWLVRVDDEESITVEVIEGVCVHDDLVTGGILGSGLSGPYFAESVMLGESMRIRLYGQPQESTERYRAAIERYIQMYVDDAEDAVS